MPLNRPFPALLVTLAVSTVFGISLPASADDKADCVKAAAQGQALRDDHKLVEARTQFRVCARQVCPTVIRRDCASWLDAADKSVPTVVVSAKSVTGADLVDVTVRLDGAPFVTKLDGRAVPVNPGLHAFHFETSDGSKVDQQVMVKEGVQDQSVAVAFPSEAVPDAVAAGTLDAPPSDAAPSRNSSAITTVGWAVGGIGLAGLAAGGILGYLALDDKNKASCDANGYCDPGHLGDARTLSTASTIAFISGGVLAATGLALVLFAPKRDAAPAMGTLTASPMVGQGGGGIDLRGSF